MPKKERQLLDKPLNALGKDDIDYEEMPKVDPRRVITYAQFNHHFANKKSVKKN